MIRANKTSYLALNCSIDGIEDPEWAVFKWKKLASDDLESDPVIVSDSSHLEFKSLKTKDSGKYACRVNDEYESDVYEVRVDEYEPLSLEIYVQETSGDEKEIILLCLNLRGKPSPKIEWLTDDGEQIENANIVSNEFGVELRLPRDHTPGIFKCVAQNELEQKIAFINTKTCKL